jgi:anti-sigma regulatory factor (Ser/Thr protein kinase)
LSRGDAGNPSESVTATFPNEAESVWIAQLWCREAIAPWVSGEVGERIELVLHELVANAVVHGEGDIEVGLVRYPDHVEVSVSDAGRGEIPVQPGAGGVGGRGLAVVWALSSKWGVRTLRERKGKQVWADVGLGTGTGST